MARIFHDRVLRQKPTAQRTDRTKEKGKGEEKGGKREENLSNGNAKP